MKTITLQQLKEREACASQVELFQKYFGSEVELTPEVVQKYAQEFDINWCAQNLLTSELYERYYEAIAIAWKQYDDARAIAGKQYYEARVIAWKQYDEAKAIVWKQYNEARAILFVSLYNKM